MKIPSLKFFQLLRLRICKLTSFLKAKDEARQVEDQEWDLVDLKAYTIVDRTPGGRKCDLLTSVHMGSRQLDQARVWQKTGKARWHMNVNEQMYKPSQIRIDPQLEFICDKLGLSKDMEQTVIGSPKPLS